MHSGRGRRGWGLRGYCCLLSEAFLQRIKVRCTNSGGSQKLALTPYRNDKNLTLYLMKASNQEKQKNLGRTLPFTGCNPSGHRAGQVEINSAQHGWSPSGGSPPCLAHPSGQLHEGNAIHCPCCISEPPDLNAPLENYMFPLFNFHVKCWY